MLGVEKYVTRRIQLVNVSLNKLEKQRKIVGGFRCTAKGVSGSLVETVLRFSHVN